MRGTLFVTLSLLLLAGTAPANQTLDEARSLHIAGDVDAALTAYARVADEAGDDDPASVATALNNSCVILNGLGRFEEARAACEKALASRRVTDDTRRLARTLNNLALALQNLGEYAEARSIYLEALEINHRRDDVPSQVLNLSNLGALAIVAGEYGRALEFHDRAAKLARQHANESWAEEQLQIASANRGVVLERLGAYREALDLYRNLIAELGASSDPRRRAQLELNIGVIYRNLGDPARAIQAFETVATIYRELEDADGLSNALLNLALAYHLNFAAPERAEAAYREALDLASRHGDRPEEIQDLFYLGQFLLDQDRLDEAGSMFDRCLAASQASGSREGKWSALAGLGRVAIARDRPALAIEFFEKASAEIERVGESLGESRLLSGYFGDKRPVFSAAIRAYADLERLEPGSGHAERALEVVQRAKARALLDALGSEEWDAKPLAAAELRKSVGNGLILEYFIAEDTLLRWSIRANGVTLDDLGPIAPIREKALRVYSFLSDGAEPPGMLLNDLLSLLPGAGSLPPSGTLHLALDGPLHRLPFALLLDPESPDAPLVERVAMSYLPSASALGWLQERDLRRPLAEEDPVSLRAFAAPDMSVLTGKPGSPASLFASRYGLEQLPAAEGELASLAHHLPGKAVSLRGINASETAFRSDSAPTRILHIASHAVVDERPGRSAAILLAPDDENDGLLEPREIAGLEQRTALTVLSACRTAAGSAEGDALATLAGSFLAAGSSAVVATLWDVEDKAAAVFMDQFYYQLGRGVAPATALRKAQLRFRDDPAWSSSHLWAGYVLIGEADSPIARSWLSPLPLAVLAAALGLVLFLVGKRALRSR
jgi:tetratricopeptide (TPR) repeat protein